MNLCNGKSGDWDVLARNTNMIIGDTSEDYGLDLTLFFGEFGEVIIVEAVGKRREKIIQYRHLMAEMAFEWVLAVPREMEIVAEIPLGILVVDTSFTMEHAFGISRTQNIDVEIPFSTLIWHLSDVEISVPLAVFHSQSMDFEIPLGKTLEGSRRKLKKLEKALEELDKV